VYVVVGAAAQGIDGAEWARVDGVAGVWQFAQEDGGREITVAWVDRDLWETSALLGARCRDLGAGVEWAGPLERVDPNQWDWFG
jgi:hypothetical protein